MTKSAKAGFLAALGCVLLAGLVLSGCREEEAGRILYYKKGTYLGQPDQPLDSGQLEVLRRRAQRQSIY